MCFGEWFYINVYIGSIYQIQGIILIVIKKEDKELGGWWSRDIRVSWGKKIVDGYDQNKMGKYINFYKVNKILF